MDDIQRLAADAILEDMGVMEPGGGLADEVGRQFGRHSPRLLEIPVANLAQASALDILHRDERLLFLLPVVLKLHDVRVIEVHHHLDLGAEHAHEFRVRAVAGLDALDDKEAPEPVRIHLTRAKDLGHAALGDLVEEEVASEFFQDFLHSGIRLLKDPSEFRL